jgi:hypothetical protein
MNTELIKNALEYYDKNKEIYDSFINQIKYRKIIKSPYETEHYKIEFYKNIDSNNNFTDIIHTTRYEIIGRYNITHKLWRWEWNNIMAIKKTTYIITKILKYGIELDPEEKFLKTELINGTFIISNKIQLDIHVAISSYLGKCPFIYPFIKIYGKENKGKNFTNITLNSIDNIDDYPEESEIIYLILLDLPKI